MRDLASAKLQDGDSTVSARYARERKHSALELLEKSRHKARNIFERQVSSKSIPRQALGISYSGCTKKALSIRNRLKSDQAGCRRLLLESRRQQRMRAK